MNSALPGEMESQSRRVQSIVLVDDEDDVLRSLERDLRSWTRSRNLVVYSVHSGEECLRLVNEEYPAVGLVISDLRMPGMSGADLFSTLNEKFPDIGCVMVTAFADMDQITRAVSSSMMGLVQKPWIPEQLEADLDRALEQVEFRRSAEERNRELNQQLELAGAFQQAAMAVTIPPDDRVEYIAFSRPAKEMHVTGDFHDFLRLDKDRYLLLVGDVAGHGMRAALLSAMLKIVVRSYVDRDRASVSGPAELLRQVNMAIATYLPRTSGMIASCAATVVDLQSQTVQVANAGHPPVFVVDDDTFEHSAVLDPAMGISTDTWYGEESLSLRSGSRIVLFSDGLYSNVTKDDEYFSTKRTGTIFQRAHTGTHFSDEVVRLVMADRILHGRPTVPLFDDDVTIVSLVVL